jgi:hypothetical protein
VAGGACVRHGAAGLARELRGPRVFGLLGAAANEQVSGQQMDEIATALASRLAG